jgi:ribosomal protein S18 acetylase RimI-like enzyme
MGANRGLPGTLVVVTGEMVRIVSCGPERAVEVHRLTQRAFQQHGRLDPPSGALRETPARVRDDLQAGGGAIAELGVQPVGCLRWQLTPRGDFHVRRVAVEPPLRRRGIGRELMAWAEREARRRGCRGISLGVRIALDDNLAFFRSLGYEVTGTRRHDGYDRPTWFALRKSLRGT